MLQRQPVPIDQDDFKKWAANLADAGAEVLKAAKPRSTTRRHGRRQRHGLGRVREVPRQVPRTRRSSPKTAAARPPRQPRARDPDETHGRILRRRCTTCYLRLGARKQHRAARIAVRDGRGCWSLHIVSHVHVRRDDSDDGPAAARRRQHADAVLAGPAPSLPLADRRHGRSPRHRRWRWSGATR